MNDASLLLFYAIIAVFAYFVAAPMLLNAISLFGVQKRFARAMVDEGVVTEEEVQRLHPKKQVAGVVISLVVTGLLVSFCIKMAPIGYFCGALPLIAVLLKYRQILQFNSLTVDRFRNTYKDVMNTEKYNRYVSKQF